MAKSGPKPRPPADIATCARTIRFTRSDMDQLHALARLTRQTGAQVIRQLIRATRWSGQYPVQGSCLPPEAEERSGE